MIDLCIIIIMMHVVLVLPQDEASISASGLHAVGGGLVREARVRGLALSFVDLDGFGSRACLDAEGHVEVKDVNNYRKFLFID